jgi:hypothetical protein
MGREEAAAHFFSRDADRITVFPGRNFPLGQLAVAHEAMTPILGLLVGVRGEETCNLGLDSMGKPGACPFRKSCPRVLMMQSGQNGRGDNGPASLDRSRQRCIFVQRQMRSRLMQ